MKRYLTIFVLLCTISTVHGAHFSHYAGGFRASCDVYAWDDPLLASWSGADDDTTYAFLERTATVSQAYGHADNKITSDIRNNSIYIKSHSAADGAADFSDCYARGSGFGGTQDFQTYGIFYKIMPDANEHVGDDVMVYYNDMVSISSAMGTNYVRIGGPGTMDHIAITRGQLPPVLTEPVRENEVLSFPKVEVSNSGNSDWFSGVHAFPAQIGDVIGIFAQNSTKVEGWGPLLVGSIDSTFTMILTVRPVLLGDLDYDGDVDFFDLAKLANNWLVDIGSEQDPDTIPPEPNPMEWAEGGEPHEIECSPYYCATMTAKIATDPSGGVRYEFQCSEGGFSSSWQSSPTYTVTIGPSGHNYTFKVRARDIHENKTGWSSELPMN
ncbi:MAG: hypothetical protein ACYSUY_10130 [Planctomycetota bacterium]|jgi:hypothetical protein